MVPLMLVCLLFPMVAYAQGAAVSDPQPSPSCAQRLATTQDELAVMIKFVATVRQRGETDLLTAARRAVQAERAQDEVVSLTARLAQAQADIARLTTALEHAQAPPGAVAPEEPGP